MTNNKQLTAVEWYISKIKEARILCDDPSMEMDIRHTLEVLIKKGEQAKEMEKEKAIKLYIDYENYLHEEFKHQNGGQAVILSFREFYEQTYGGDEQ
jgi:hypothetical protein